MHRIQFIPGHIHRTTWKLIEDSGYGEFLDTDNIRKEELSIRLFTSVLKESFLSVPDAEREKHGDVFADFVTDIRGLNLKLAANGEVEPPRAALAASNRADYYYGLRYVKKVPEVMVLTEPLRFMCEIAYGLVRDALRDAVLDSLIERLRTLGKRYNEYAMVDVNVKLDGNRKVYSLEVEIGDDIRHVFYAKHNPGRRYSGN